MIRDLPADTSKQLLLKRRCVKQGRLEKMTEAVRKPATILKQYKFSSNIKERSLAVSRLLCIPTIAPLSGARLESR